MQTASSASADQRIGVAVVIPALDPGEKLAAVLKGLPSPVCMAVVVDDGSRVPVAASDTATGIRVEVIRHPENRGVGAAIVTGYRRCRELGMDVAVVMGADDQMDPADLGALLEPVLAGRAVYSKGDRLSHPACRRTMPTARLFGNCCLTFLTRIFTGLPVMDSQCGYTALRLDALDRLPVARLYPRYGFPNDMLAALSGAGLPVADVVVRAVYRDEPSGIRPSVAALVYPFIIIRSLVTRAVAWSGKTAVRGRS